MQTHPLRLAKLFKLYDCGPVGFTLLYLKFFVYNQMPDGLPLLQN